MGKFILFGKKKASEAQQQAVNERNSKRLTTNLRFEAYKALKKRDHLSKERRAIAEKLARAEDNETRNMLKKELKGKRSLLNILTRTYQLNTLRADLLEVGNLVQKSIGAVTSIENPEMAGVQLSQLQEEFESLASQTFGQQLELDKCEGMLDQLVDNTESTTISTEDTDLDELEDIMLEEGKASEEEMIKHLLEKY